MWEVTGNDGARQQDIQESDTDGQEGAGRAREAAVQTVRQTRIKC